MNPAWKNQTKNEKPNQHPVACWAEEVYNATFNCLKWCICARCLFWITSFLPGGLMDAWQFGPNHGIFWNLWGPCDYPGVPIASASFLLYLLSAKLSDWAPTFGKPAEEKMYHTFSSFYIRYLNEHNEPRDRVAHVFEFFGVAVFMFLNLGRFTAFCLALGLGTLLTRPLLHIQLPRIENTLMYVIGATVATFYGVPISYAFGYAVWLAFDYVGHAYVGENKAAAAFLGRHYLGWALVGQTWFACSVAANFPAEVGEALRCVTARRACTE